MDAGGAQGAAKYFGCVRRFRSSAIAVRRGGGGSARRDYRHDQTRTQPARPHRTPNIGAITVRTQSVAEQRCGGNVIAGDAAKMACVARADESR